MCACYMQYIKSQLVDFTLTDDVTTYYWIEKQTYITYNTLNYSPNDVFYPIRDCHMAQSCAYELFSTDGHN